MVYKSMEQVSLGLKEDENGGQAPLYGRSAWYFSLKINQYRSPFPPFSSFGGGGNLDHYRYGLLCLDAYKNIISPK